MTVFSLLSGINLSLAIVMFIVAVIKLHSIHDVATSQIVAPASVISVAMIVLHLIGIVTHDKFGPENVIESAWKVVDMITILLIIRLIKIIKD